MTAGRAAILALAFSLSTGASAASAQTPERQVILFLVDGMSYEEALALPTLRTLARAGGIGLMTEAQEGLGPYVTLGAGASVEGAPVNALEFQLQKRGRKAVVDPRVYRQPNAPAPPGLLGTAIRKGGFTVGYVGSSPATRLPGLLVAMDERGEVSPTAIASPVRIGVPPGTTGVRRPRPAEVYENAELVVAEERPLPSATQDRGRRRQALAGLDAAVRSTLSEIEADDVLVLVVVPAPTEEMVDRGDTVTPLIAAVGDPDDLIDARGSLEGLTSATTRRDGVVSNIDVAPTVLEFLGVAVPSAMTGAPIRAAETPPTELHRRYLDYRRVVAPVGLVVLAVALSALVLGVAMLVAWPGAPRWLARVVAALGLFGVGMQVAMLPGSYLPSFSFPLTMGAVAGGGAALAVVALVMGRRSAVAAVVVVAAAGVALVVLDAALGWRSLLTPLLGGSALDGVRFFGLGNAYAGVVLAGTVLGAATLVPGVGAAVLAAAALFAGLPWAGSDIGGGLTLFVAAGIWYGIRRRGRVGVREITLAVAALVFGFAILVLAHRLAPEATHVTRAVEGSGGLGGVASFFVRRLSLNLEATAAAPFVWPALLGLPVGLVLAWRRPTPIRPAFDRSPGWREAVMVLAVGGIMGYVLNDTYGMATVTFIYLLLAILYPALAARWMTR